MLQYNEENIYLKQKMHHARYFFIKLEFSSKHFKSIDSSRVSKHQTIIKPNHCHVVKQKTKKTKLTVW